MTETPVTTGDIAADGNPAPGDAATPPWGTEADFNAEKAWNLIQNLRADKDKLLSREVITDEQKQALAEYTKVVEANKTDLQRQTEQTTRWQAEAESWRGQAVAARVTALAATDFADPSDAANALSAANYLDAGGQIDEAAIRRDLADLLERKPHWRRTPDGPQAPRVPIPNPAQGAGGGQPAAGDPAAAFAALLQGQISGSR